VLFSLLRTSRLPTHTRESGPLHLFGDIILLERVEEEPRCISDERTGRPPGEDYSRKKLKILQNKP
jgi:hypothetical protein